MDFLDHAANHGLRIRTLIADGRWHRVPTDDKPRKRNGAYLCDGVSGVVRNWATMEHYAAWRQGSRTGKVDRSALRARIATDRAQERARHIEVGQQAGTILRAATLVTPRPADRWRDAIPGHPYLTKKGFPTLPFFADGDTLLVPMRSPTGELWNLQRIFRDGDKRFVPGGRAKGLVFELGPKRAQEVWLVEGYATGLSVRAALERLYRPARVVVCFSAGNLVHIARQGIGTHVFADHDASGTGQQSAEQTGLPWVMWTDIGDANDMHQADGLGAVAQMIRSGVRARAA